jgi:hypothetical protein
MVSPAVQESSERREISAEAACRRIVAEEDRPRQCSGQRGHPASRIVG